MKVWLFSCLIALLLSQSEIEDNFSAMLTAQGHNNPPTMIASHNQDGSPATPLNCNQNCTPVALANQDQ